MGWDGLRSTKMRRNWLPNKSKITSEAFKAKIQAQNINYRNQPLPVLHQNEPYIYIRIQLVPSLKWKLQTHITATKITDQCKQLANYPATIKHKNNMVDTVIRAGIAYSFYAVPYSLPTIKKNVIGIQNNMRTAKMHSKCNNPTTP